MGYPLQGKGHRTFKDSTEVGRFHHDIRRWGCVHVLQGQFNVRTLNLQSQETL